MNALAAIKPGAAVERTRDGEFAALAGCISAVEVHDPSPKQNAFWSGGTSKTNPERPILNELHLFAGCGGGILGGILLGHHPVCAVEIEPYCRKVLLQRQRDGVLPRFPVWDDVRTFAGGPWNGIADIVCGGFPCQDISAAGRGAGIEGERSGLWGEFARVVREVGPGFVFVENSPLLTSRGLGRVLGDLAEMGYDAEWGVLGADDAGAPHRRKRIWILAHAGHLRRRDGAEPTKTQPAAIAGRGEVADSAKPGLEGSSERRSTVEGGGGPWRATEPSEGGGEVGDAMRRGQSRPWKSWYASDPAEDGEGQADQPFDERVGHIWGIESRLGRVAHGVANRMDRLKSIGNGQVPSVAALAWRVLSERARLRGMRVELPKGAASASEGRKYNGQDQVGDGRPTRSTR